MRKLSISFLSLFIICAINAQSSQAELLQDLEKNQPSNQELKLTATTKASTRLFGAKDDLTTVIMVIPKGSEVNVIGSDSTYFHVIFEESDGYILRRHAVLNDPIDVSKPVIQKVEPVQETQPAVQQEQQGGRFAYLENKYGSSMAAKLIAGKIWKGMSSEMLRDSWGKPQRINRVISGNTVKEEWIYKYTWIYLENDTLFEWGQIKN
jgi:hypothetical protein